MKTHNFSYLSSQQRNYGTRDDYTWRHSHESCSDVFQMTEILFAASGSGNPRVSIIERHSVPPTRALRDWYAHVFSLSSIGALVGAWVMSWGMSCSNSRLTMLKKCYCSKICRSKRKKMPIKKTKRLEKLLGRWKLNTPGHSIPTTQFPTTNSPIKKRKWSRLIIMY